MNKAFCFALAFLSFAVYADGQQMNINSVNALGAGSTTNKVVTSDIKREKAWVRDVVTVDQLGQIHNDSGIIGRTVETSAINEVADNSAEISEAATTSMNNSMQYLLTKTNQMATVGLGIALAFPPETDDPNIRGFVVKSEVTNSTYDALWVHYNCELSLPPNRTVVYATYGQETKVKANWDSWSSTGVTMTVNGKVWSGLHRCTIERPVWCRGKSCLDLPNEVWGGSSGMDFGDMTLVQSNQVAYFTGYVTNSIAGKVAYFDNGFLKEIKNAE